MSLGHEPAAATARTAEPGPRPDPRLRAPTPRDVWAARKRVAGIARRTLLRPAADLGPNVYVADETVQPTGAFKVRGAANALLSLPADDLARGVVAVSTGNHGRAVAYVAQRLVVSATVFVSQRVPQDKLDGLRSVGATVVISGDSQDEAEDAARLHAAEQGSALIPPFDHPAVIAGQGTLGLEVLEALPDVHTALVPLSGGGLIAGVALALKSADPAIRVVGVSMERGAVMHASLQVGRQVEMPEAETLADSLQGGLGHENRFTLQAVQELVDDVLLVPEGAIAAAMRHMFKHHRLVLEGAGAAASAAVLAGMHQPPQSEATAGGSTVVVASGGNVDADLFARVLQGWDGP